MPAAPAPEPDAAPARGALRAPGLSGAPGAPNVREPLAPSTRDVLDARDPLAPDPPDVRDVRDPLAPVPPDVRDVRDPLAPVPPDVRDARDAPDPLDRLAPSARRAPRRTRVAVGAAIVCFVLAVAVAALLSAAGGGDQGMLPLDGGAAASGAPGSGGADGAESGAPGVQGAQGAAVLVHVLGAVARPGLVELAAGARVVDAISAAGGLTAEADASGVNLARPVTDGEQLLVPVVGQAPPAGASPPGQASGGGTAGSGGAAAPGGASTGLVHLNTATLADLDTLPRIGPALAQRILDWRDANGPFTSVEQLREVAGIGDATFAGLVDLVGL